MSTSQTVLAGRQCHVLQIILALALLLTSACGFSASSGINQCLRRGRCVSSKIASSELCLSRRPISDNPKSSHIFETPLDMRTSHKSGLFYSNRSKSSAASKLQMATSDDTNDVSNNNNSSNPFVKVWLWFRQLLAKIWVSAASIIVL